MSDGLAWALAGGSRLARALDAKKIARLEAEVARLRRWKDEALPVMAGLQDLGRVLGMRLGTSITGETAADAARALVARAEAAEAEVVRLRVHSVQLNALSWRIALTVGDVPPGAESIEGDPDEQLGRLIAERERPLGSPDRRTRQGVVGALGATPIQ